MAVPQPLALPPRESDNMTNVIRLLVCAVGVAVAGVSSAAQRTFVASYGLSANTAFNCSISKPCRSFGEAISVTDAAGEVVVLDSAGYGPVTITQSVSIIAPAGVYAGVSVFSADGIVVSAGPSGNVVLRGLTINGQGGARGIVHVTGGRVDIDRCIVSGMTGNGIEVGAGAGAITIADTVVERNGGHGIQFIDRVSGVSTGQLTSVRSANNAFRGLFIGAGAQVRISSSVFHGNGTGGVWALTGTSNPQPVILDLSRSVVSANGSEGVVVVVQGGAATFMQALITGNVVTDNAVAGIEIGMSSAAAGGARAVITGNEVRGHFIGIAANRANTQVILNGNAVAQASGNGIQIQNGAIVRSRGDNVVDDNATNQVGAAVPVNVM
ncbi:MAG: right-handed parallel beta-helix repeat-containing protein [Casimicrobiaceae bacterium]